MSPLPPLSRPANPLLPVLASQAVAAALMLAGELDWLDWQLLTLGEAWLVHLTLLAYGRDEPAAGRAANFALVSLVVLPALWMFLALLGTLMLHPDDARPPWTIVFEGVERLRSERLRGAFAFVLAGLAVSLLQVQRAPDRARWWSQRVVAQYQVNLVATLASLFLLGPLLILRKEVGWVRAIPPQAMDAALLSLLAALRALIAWRMAAAEGTGQARRPPKPPHRLRR